MSVEAFGLSDASSSQSDVQDMALAQDIIT